MPNGAELVAAVISGALDIGLSAIGSIAEAREKGLPVKCIAPAGMSLSTAPTDIMMVAKDSPLRTGADFAGKTIAVNGIGNVLMYGTQLWIDKTGGNSKSVKFVEMPFPVMADAVVSKRVDGATMAEPYISDARLVAKPLANVMDAISPRFPATLWFATDAWLAASPDVAAKVVSVFRQAAIWANAHHKESGDIVLKHTKIKPETLAVMTRSVYGTELLVSELQPGIDAGVRYGAIDKPLAATEIIWKPAKS
jgi:NitT/TauT family transport system substrate-binding protein